MTPTEPVSSKTNQPISHDAADRSTQSEQCQRQRTALRWVVLANERLHRRIRARLPEPNTEAGEEQLPDRLSEAASRRHDAPDTQTQSDDGSSVAHICPTRHWKRHER